MTDPAHAALLERLLSFGAALLEGTLDGADRAATVLAGEVATNAATFWTETRAAAEARTAAYFALLDDGATGAAELRAARTEIEAFFAACAALGEPLDEQLHDRVAARDGELEARLG